MTTAACDDLITVLRTDLPGRAVDPGSGWPAVLDLAAEHRLLPGLWAGLRSRGIRTLPDALTTTAEQGRSPLALLQGAYEKNESRVESVLTQSERTIAGLADAGIEATPIKGAHWLLAGWLPDPAARTTIDVDLLVGPADADRAQGALLAAGYGRVHSSLDEWADHQLPALVEGNGEVAVELHVAPLLSIHAAVITGEEIVAAAEPATIAGRTGRVPSATDAITLLIAHAQLQDFTHRFRRPPLRALADLAQLSRAGRLDGVDWDRVQARFDRADEHDSLAGFAVAAAQWFDIGLPVDQRGGDRWVAACRRALDSPRWTTRYERRGMVTLTLGAARMDRLYGSHGAWDRTGARLRHLARGLRQRSRVPPT